MGLFKTDFELPKAAGLWLTMHGEDPSPDMLGDIRWAVPPKHILGPDVPARVQEALDLMAASDTPLTRACAASEISRAVPGTYVSEYVARKFADDSEYFTNVTMSLIFCMAQGPSVVLDPTFLAEWATVRAALQRIADNVEAPDCVQQALSTVDSYVEGRLKKSMQSVNMPAFVSRHDAWWAGKD